MNKFDRKYLTCFVVRLDDGNYWLFKNKLQFTIFFKTYYLRVHVIAIYRGYCYYYEERGFKYFYEN